MDRTKTTGVLLVAGAAVELLLFLFGITRRSYAALAVPVTTAVTGLTGLMMWVGWTMITTDADLPEPELENAPTNG